MSMRPWSRFVGLLIILLVGVSPSAAQPMPVIWSETFVNLSNSPQSSSHPEIVADGYGYIHVFWSEEVGGKAMALKDPLRSGNTIFYARWNGISWTPAIDILFIPYDDIAEFVSAAVDSQNNLHVVWTGQTNIYYSSAPSWKAESARAWSKPVVLATDSARSMWESDILVDASGVLHVIYASRFDYQGIFYMRSRDGGLNWELPTKLSSPPDTLEKSFSHARIISDKMGRLHVVWQTNQQEGYGQAVYYVRSTDNGDHWSQPFQIGYRDPGDFAVDWPYLTVVGDSELHLIYSDSERPHRFERISKDGGETWSDPIHILTNLEGTTGYTIPVVDASGQLHLIADMRTIEEQIGGIYYAQWLGERWSEPVLVNVPFEAIRGAHYVAVAVRLGNELHLVWNEFARSEIWHTYGTIPSVEPIQPLTPLLVETPTPVVTDAAMSIVSAVVSTPMPMPQKSPKQPLSSTLTVPPSPDTGLPLMVGIGAALLLIASVVIVWAKERAF